MYDNYTDLGTILVKGNFSAMTWCRGCKLVGRGNDMPEPIDVERFGQRLRRVREGRRVTLEKTAKATGVSVASLSRIERGGSKDIDAGTMMSLCKWMGAKPEDFRVDAAPPKPPGKRTPATTPEAVELYLRADKNLDQRTAALLSEMFKAAYQKLAKSGTAEIK